MLYILGCRLGRKTFKLSNNCHEMHQKATPLFYEALRLIYKDLDAGAFLSSLDPMSARYVSIHHNRIWRIIAIVDVLVPSGVL